MLSEPPPPAKQPSYSPVTLDTVTKGSKCIVTDISSSNKRLKIKLMTMGIIAGTVIEVSAIAPLGDPITIEALGYSLSLRLSEASQVHVMPLALRKAYRQ